MSKEVPTQQIEAEVQPGYRPPAIDSGITILPLSMLGDRDFELLSYLLIKSEIEAGEHKEISKIALMQGVAERGRDCTLYKGDSVCGLIQCKKYSGRVTRPQLIKEIVKFLLFSIADRSLLPDPDTFEYKIYVSNDLTEPAIVLVHSFSTEIDLEISSGAIGRYAKEIVDEYESFSAFRGSPPITELEELLRRISITSSNATDLSARIYRKDHILKMFFNVKSIVSVEDAERIVRRAMDDYGLKYLTDDDLKDLKSRIESTSDTQRINLGLVDFYGFDRGFFRYLKADGQKEIITKAVEIKQFLDFKLMEFIQDEIRKRIYSEVTEKLLRFGRIHPFSVGLAAPYLYRRLSTVIIASNLPEEVMKKVNPGMYISREELITEVSRTLLDGSERVMKGDYSELVGDAEMISFKIRLFDHMHIGFGTISDAKDRLSIDLKLLIPVLDRIESELLSLLSKTRTIVIKDGSFFGDGTLLRRVVETTKAIDTSKI